MRLFKLKTLTSLVLFNLTLLAPISARSELSTQDLSNKEGQLIFTLKWYDNQKKQAAYQNASADLKANHQRTMDGMCEQLNSIRAELTSRGAPLANNYPTALCGGATTPILPSSTNTSTVNNPVTSNPTSINNTSNTAPITGSTQTGSNPSGTSINIPVVNDTTPPVTSNSTNSNNNTNLPTNSSNTANENNNTSATHTISNITNDSAPIVQTENGFAVQCPSPSDIKGSSAWQALFSSNNNIQTEFYKGNTDYTKLCVNGFAWYIMKTASSRNTQFSSKYQSSFVNDLTPKFSIIMADSNGSLNYSASCIYFLTDANNNKITNIELKFDPIIPVNYTLGKLNDPYAPRTNSVLTSELRGWTGLRIPKSQTITYCSKSIADCTFTVSVDNSASCNRVIPPTIRDKNIPTNAVFCPTTEELIKQPAWEMMISENILIRQDISKNSKFTINNHQWKFGALNKGGYSFHQLNDSIPVFYQMNYNSNVQPGYNPLSCLYQIVENGNKNIGTLEVNVDVNARFDKPTAGSWSTNGNYLTCTTSNTECWLLPKSK